MKSVLIVDDEPDIASALAEILSDEGLEVHLAHDGRRALDALARKKPDLLITDLMMPVMDGHALIREVHRQEALRDLPILVTSAGLLDPSLAMSGVRFLAKPFDLDKLIAVVSELLAAPDGSRG